MTNAWYTCQEALAGLMLALLASVPCALLIVHSKSFRALVYPVLVFSQTVPKVAIAPLLVLWLGFGMLPKIVVTALVCFFPIVVNTVAGLESIEPEMIDLARSMGASPFYVFAKFRLPNSLPYFFTGLKVSITLSVVGAIISEWVGSDNGLGYLLLVASGNLDSELLFATLGVVTLLGLGLFTLIERVEKQLMPWYISQRDTVSGMM